MYRPFLSVFLLGILHAACSENSIRSRNHVELQTTHRRASISAHGLKPVIAKTLSFFVQMLSSTVLKQKNNDFSNDGFEG